jgi:hypothetical protein
LKRTHLYYILISLPITLIIYFTISISWNLKSPEFKDIESLSGDINTPEKLSDWMQRNLKYISKYGRKNKYQTVGETLEKKTGNCFDQAIFAFTVLRKNKYDAYIMLIQHLVNERMNHAICVFKQNDKIYKIDNSRLFGPYNNYESLSDNISKEWWRYAVFNDEENAINFKESLILKYRVK